MSYDLELQEGKLLLSSSLLSLLNAKPGDRVAIEYGELYSKMIPTISLHESGNILSKSNTVIFKGKERDFLAQYGTKFFIEIHDGIIFLKGDQDFKIHTNVKTAVDENYLDQSILTDTNYNITKFSEYKI